MEKLIRVSIFYLLNMDDKPDFKRYESGSATRLERARKAITDWYLSKSNDYCNGIINDECIRFVGIVRDYVNRNLDCYEIIDGRIRNDKHN